MDEARDESRGFDGDLLEENVIPSVYLFHDLVESHRVRIRVTLLPLRQGLYFGGPACPAMVCAVVSPLNQ